MSYIGLLDCNNFFVSCERLFRPDLERVPTVVLSSNDGCVVARSKEVKDMGIPMGVPYFQVKAELQKVGGVVFSSNFPLYRDISSRVMAVLREEVRVVEQYSVDEAFFGIDVPVAEVPVVLERVKQAVETQVGVPVSVGAAKTKTIAKEASEVGKKSTGTAFLHGSTWEQHREMLPINAIWGIGRQTSQKLRDLGIETVGELCVADRARIRRLFGVVGARMLDELKETAVFALGGAKDLQRSMMSTRSFKSETTDPAVIEDALAYHVAHVAEELRTLKVKAGWLSVMVRTNRHGDWVLRGGSRDVFLSIPSNDTRVLLKEVLALWRTIHEPGVPYKKAGVVVGNFSDAQHAQLELFADPMEVEQSQALMGTLDRLNQRFGKGAVTIGQRFQGTVWQTSKQYVSPAYTTNWAQIKEIEA